MTQPSASTTPGDNPRLNAILAEYMKRKDAGTPIDRQALLQAYPDLADGLRSYFQAEAMMGGMAVAETVRPKPPVPQRPANVRETVRPNAAHSDTASEFHSRSFGRYQLLRPLGEGAMGSVFLAQDTTLDRQVALKIPKTDGKGTEDFMARFSREAKAAAGLKHPNICSVYDAGEHDGTPFITMDFIDGVPLSRFIGSRQLNSVDSVLQMVATIAEAVGHAHSKGVIHRDLKPGNILVDAEFRPIVTDFGLARRTGHGNDSRVTQEGLLIGTPAYMAPEQVKGEQAKVGPRSDIYSLGVMLFEMLTSQLPFEGADGSIPDMLAKILRDHPPAPGKFRKDLSEDVDDLCVKMLKKDPEKRFNSMADVVTAIGQLRAKLKRAPVNEADVARQQSPFEIQKAHLEQMLKNGQYAAVIQDMEKLAKETLPGAKAVAEWARKTLPGVRAEAKALNPAGLAALLQTAREMFEKHDYPGVIQVLEDIPALRRTEAIEELLERAQSREAEAEQLLSDIKERERNQHLDGIEVLVKRLLKLKPGNSYAKRLWEALQSYSKTPATRRTYRYEKGRLQPMPELGFLQQWAVLGWLVGALVFMPVFGYVVIYFKSDKQTLAVHVDDAWLKENGGELTLLVDGDTHTISTNSPNGEALNVTVTLGDHTFSVKHGNSVVNNPESFTIQRDGRQILSITATDIELVTSVPVPRPPVPPDPTPIPDPPPVPTPNNPEPVEPGTVPNKSLLPTPISFAGADPGQGKELVPGMKFRWCPPGNFTMGSPPLEAGHQNSEMQVSVTLSNGFWLGETEVTQGSWLSVQGTQPWTEKNDVKSEANFPAVFVNHGLRPNGAVEGDSATEFCEKLTVTEQAAGRLPSNWAYRLPTEAEWEYACRAGSTGRYCYGDAANFLTSFAWYDTYRPPRSEAYAHMVAQKQPNGWGLYDMHGNVWEWCQDTYREVLPGRTDPIVNDSGSKRVLRGGSWGDLEATALRSAHRAMREPSEAHNTVGFRVAAVASDRVIEGAVATPIPPTPAKPDAPTTSVITAIPSIVETLPAPIQLSPKDGTFLGNRPQKNIMKWKPVPGATLYRVQIQFIIGPNGELGPACDFEAKTNQFENDLKGNRPKRWRVGTASGSSTAWSDWWEFRYRS